MCELPPQPSGPGWATGAGSGADRGWHAVAAGARVHAESGDAGFRFARAECGDLVYLTRHGPYDRSGPPVTRNPCALCAWLVALAQDRADRELVLLSNDVVHREAVALQRAGFDPQGHIRLCRAILSRAAAHPDGIDPGEVPVVARLLAAAVNHRPGLAITEDCRDRACEHQPCTFPDARAVCWACSLTAGDEAGEWTGQLMPEGTVTAPCGVYSALAAYYHVKI